MPCLAGGVRCAVLPLLLVLVLGACSSDSGQPETHGAPGTASATSRPTPPATSTPTSPSATSSAPSATVTGPTSLRGIDLSHHQGAVDWSGVAGAGIAFAYLKASEGTGYVDPTFAAHRTAARRNGLRVGGYHYFQLCSAGLAQAEHLISVLGPRLRPDDLAPAVDLELAGSCADPPPRDQLLTQVRAFLRRLQQEYDVRPVVYLFPDFEARFGFADELATYPQWVRRLGGRPPQRPWRVWQHDQHGTVPGVSGPVDLDRMRP